MEIHKRISFSSWKWKIYARRASLEESFMGANFVNETERYNYARHKCVLDEVTGEGENA